VNRCKKGALASITLYDTWWHGHIFAGYAQ